MEEDNIFINDSGLEGKIFLIAKNIKLVKIIIFLKVDLS